MRVFLFSVFALSLAGCGGGGGSNSGEDGSNVETVTTEQWNLGLIPNLSIDCLEVSSGAGNLGVDETLDGSWRQFRRDKTLSGRSPLIGNITCPEQLWAIDLGARKSYISVRPGSETNTIELPVLGEFQFSGATREQFEADANLFDLDGDGSQIVTSVSLGPTRTGDFIPALPGLERISCDPSLIGLMPVANNSLPCFMHNRNNGVWDKLWETPPLAGIAPSWTLSGQPIIGDFDADGQDEVALLAWYHVYLLDLATGAIEQTGTFHVDPVDPNDWTTPRGYGWFSAVNLDNDPKLEIVIQGYYEKFVSVLGWNGGSLEELWDYQFFQSIVPSQVAHHPDVNGVGDVDGDGVKDVVTSVFNENGDRKWHILVFDGNTGAIKLDLPDRILSGLHNLDGDDVLELFVSSTNGYAKPRYGPVSIVSYKNAVQSTLWSAASQSFPAAELPDFPNHTNSRFPAFKTGMFFRSGWTSGNPVFATQERVDEVNVKLRIYQWQGAGLREVGSINGPRASIESLPTGDPSKGILVRFFSTNAGEGSVEISNLDALLESSNRVSLYERNGDPAVNYEMLTSTVVGRLESSSKPTIITQDFLNNIHAYEITQNNPQLLWKTTGRGMVSGDGDRGVSPDSGFGSILLADVDGTGVLMPLVAHNPDQGYAQLRALNEDGSLRWDYVFDLPGDAPLQSFGGLTHWLSGNFNHLDREDILVGVRHGSTHSTEMHMIDGQTGVLDWIQSDGGFYSDCNAYDITGPGGSLMTIFDWDGDGLDDLLDTFISRFNIYDGDTGATHLNRWVTDWCGSGAPEQIFSPGIHTGALTLVGDFLDNGGSQVLYGKNATTMALLQDNGDLIWNTPLYDGMRAEVLQGIGDFDGDTEIDILVAGHCGSSGQEIRKYDSKTGAVSWHLALPASCEGTGPKIVTSDIDGDGRDEILVAHMNMIYAIGENDSAQGEMLWTVTLPTALENGDPVVADVDGSGRPQILINTIEGYLYAVGQPH